MAGNSRTLSESVRERFLFFVPFLIVFSIWEILVFLSLLDPLLYPGPTQIFNSAINLLTKRSPNLIDHLIRSLFHIFMGYSLGVGFGILCGTILGLSTRIYSVFYPIFALLIPVPTIAWVPLLLIILGLNDLTIIVAIFLGCFFPIVYNTLTGIRSTDKQLVWAAETMGAGKLDLYFEVILPSSLLSMITGLRLAVGYSWRALVGAEMLASIPVGIGYMIYSSRWGFNIDIMFTGLIIIALGGLIMDRILLRPLEIFTIERWGLIQKQGEK